MPVATDIHVIETAYWPMPEGMMMQMGGDEIVPASCPAYVIDHPDALVLFDTGLSHDLVADPVGYGAPGLADFTPNIDLGTALADGLADLGYEPADVDHVVMSHLHVDHAGNLDLFSDATIHVHLEELRYAWWPDAAQAVFYVDADLAPLRDPSAAVTEVVGRTDLLGDGSIEIVPTPGHTPGHQSLAVDLEDETVFLASDVANLHRAFDAELVAPFHWSAAEGVRSIRAVKAEFERAGATVVIHHDVDDLEQLR